MIPDSLKVWNNYLFGTSYLYSFKCLGYGAVGAGGVIPPNANIILKLNF
jgi:hypothetical protein